MKWLDRLLGRPTSADEREQDRRAIKELHQSFDKVASRTERLERELLRVNAELRRKVGQSR